MLLTMLEMDALGTLATIRSSAEDLILQNSKQTMFAASAMADSNTTEMVNAETRMGEESRILMQD